MVIKKAIIPAAGLGTRFLPLSKFVPKELWPIVDKATIQYIVEEAIASGIKEIVLVVRPGKENILAYLKDVFSAKRVSFSKVYQKEQLGDGHAVLQAKTKEITAVLFGDDIVESKTPALLQMMKVFNKYQRPVIALHKISKEKLSAYGVVKVDKISKGVYKVKDIVEKPSIKQAPSNLAIVGKYIITPEVFSHIKASTKAKGEIRLAGAFQDMLKKGETIYGCEFEGKWLECGNKQAYLKSNLYLSLKHPQFGKELKQFLKKENF
ncbi:MAG: UTP--glucose-1-phosphate uridylyltransferase [Candidatus Nealsonbacteria bacterium]|nr:UTP--glucose-1-phosphate uridylyltransferase [Candidatus Nealsonbacteria bacterium]